METPSSTRGATAAAGNTAPVSMKSRNGNEQEERSALLDITNDSPIVGLATGSLETPTSAISKKRVIINSQSKHARTPGSGETLLRGQVKNLLQKVEEEAEFSKLSVEYRRHFLNNLKGVHNSPTGVFAPTPANTPHLEFPLPSFTPDEEKFLISQMICGIFEGKKEGEEETDMVTRSLFLDFSEKSDSLDSEKKEKTPATDDDDDASSVWSIQVNASSIRDEEEEECDDESYKEEEEELCEAIRKISVNGGGARFAGKHTRFVYDSDGELQGAEEETAAAS